MKSKLEVILLVPLLNILSHLTGTLGYLGGYQTWAAKGGGGANSFTMSRAEAESSPSDSGDGKPQGRVAGGFLVRWDVTFEFPHQLLLEYKDSRDFICGAVLLNVSTIHVAITAAHCIWTGVPEKNSTIDLKSFWIAGGVENRTHRRFFAQYRHVDKAKIHPEYDPDYFWNDIAILFFYNPFLETKAVRAANLSKPGEPLPPRVVVSGYGEVENRGALSEELRFAIAETYSKEDCQKRYNRKHTLHEHHFCGWGLNGEGGCIGDSGGPVNEGADDKDLNLSLYGIVSQGIGFRCGDRRTPGVYTKIHPYLDWINEEAAAYAKSLPDEDDDFWILNIPGAK